MQIEQIETGRVLTIGNATHPLPALTRTAKVYVWQKGDDYAVYVQQQDQPEEIPAATGWHKINMLELEPDPSAVLDEQKQARRQQLKQEREELAKTPINNVQVGRIEDRENINGVIDSWESLGLTDTIEWVMADNAVQPLTKADLVAVKTGFTIRKAQCFAAYQQALEQLEQAQTEEEVLSIQLPKTQLKGNQNAY